MNLISLKNVSKTLGAKELFKNINLSISSNQKIALIGLNASGKSSLLKILSSKLEIDTGEIITNNELKISHLEQDLYANDNESIIQYILSSKHQKAELLIKYNKIEKKIKNLKKENKELNQQYHEIIEKMNLIDAWSYKSEIKSVLSALDINDYNLKINTLSGGMIKKVSLARTLLNESNLLILDEPTNHLDMESIAWLENYLINTQKAIIMVTHDRYFLDRVCNSIYEIDYPSLYFYKGNYSYYLKKREERKLSEKRHLKRLNAILKMELDWLAQGPKARSSKSKLRLENVKNLKESTKIEQEKELKIDINSKRMGKKILEIYNVSKSYGEKNIISNFSYKFKPYEKIGVLGKNGAGKTTLIKLITKQIELDNGNVDIGLNTKFGIFSQNDEIFYDKEKTVIDYLQENAQIIILKNGKTLTVKELLEQFLFPKELHFSAVSNLSGGQRRRLHLLLILVKNPNFLILDEPTNDLDIQTLSILEDFLINFNGNILIVSHDRYFIDRICSSNFIFEKNAIINHSIKSCIEYLSDIKKNKNQVIKKERIKPKTEKKSLTFKEKKEFEIIENEIENLELEKEEIENKFSSNEFINELPNLNNRYEEIKELLDKKYLRWDYLSSFE